MARIKKNAPNRKLAVQRGKAPTIDIEILCKKKDCSLVPSLLCLGEDGFTCVDPVTDQLLAPEYTYSYSHISAIVLRARPEHADIKFDNCTPPKERFRLMCSYLQILTNEIMSRTKPNQVKVIFEPGSREFSYNSPLITYLPTPTANDRKTGGFLRKHNANQIKTSQLLDHADEATKKALDEVDKDLDDISQILGNLGDVAHTMGGELERQNEQLDKIGDKVDNTSARIQKANIKMTNIIADC